MLNRGVRRRAYRGVLDYGVLGRLRVTVDGRELKLGGLRARRILAMLLLRANRTVGIARLADAAWGDEQPSTVRRQVQNRVGALRSVLCRHGTVIETMQAGYRLHVADDQLDLLLFERLVEQARTAVDRGPAERTEMFRRALGLWRGPALADLGDVVLDSEAAALEERRAAAHGDCLDLELAAGKGARLIPELTRLVNEHPLQERFVAQLMLAYHRAGRRSDALDAYAGLRTRIVEGLGIEPGEQLRQLQQRILRGESVPPDLGPDGIGGQRDAVVLEPSTTGRPPTPRQLPGDNPAFTGRAEELASIERLATASSNAGVIIAIHGVGGVGKSTLAARAARRLADRFPDGQLYLDLQGSTPGMRPLSAHAALARLLTTFGVAARDVPAELPAAAARFRSEVANRRLLVVLDNAQDAAQVRPLLPTAPGTATLVTSRWIFAELDGANPMHLEVPSERDALAYLARLVGSARTEAEPEAAGQIVRRCGRLPLALRIVGARLAARPGWPLATMARKLADAGRRLDELQVSDLAVRTSLEVSYRDLISGSSLDRAVARAFVLLGQLSGNDVGIPAAARLLDLSESEAERILERAVDANVVESFEPGRYRMHDLLRLYASELVGHLDPLEDRSGPVGPSTVAAGSPEDGPRTGPAGPVGLVGPEDRTGPGEPGSPLARPSTVPAFVDSTPLKRVFRYYLDATWAAAQVIRPGDPRTRTLGVRVDVAPAFRGLSESLDWMELEYANIQAAVRQAADLPNVHGTVATQLSAAMFAFLRLRGYWSVLADVSEAALAVAEQAKDRPAVAVSCNDLGTAIGQLGRLKEACELLLRALGTYREIGDRPGEATSLNSIGVITELQGRYDEALEWYRASLTVNTEVADPRGRAMNLGNIGPIQRRLGRYDEALSAHRRAMELFVELGDQYGQTVSLANLGALYERMGRLTDSVDCLERSLAIYREVGDRYGEAESMRSLGTSHRELRHHRLALEHHRGALRICRELGHRDGEARSLLQLGLTLRAIDRPAEARACLAGAAAVFDDLGSADAEAARALLADDE